METRCLNCGRVLTSSKGERLASAIADSNLPHMPMEDDVTWLRCGKCYKAACYSMLDAKRKAVKKPGRAG